MPLDTPRSTLCTLFDAQPGDTFWFAFAYGGSQGEWSLLLSDKKVDPGGQGLLRDLERLYALGEDPGMVATGVARVDQTGIVTFSGQDAAPRLLAHLERYVRRYQSEHPALRRLIGARYQQLTTQGRLVSAYRHDARWSDLLGDVPLLVAAQLSAAVAVLRTARPGDRLQFWLTPDAAGHGPMLVLRQSADSFDDVLVLIQDALGARPRAASGIVEVGADHRFTFASTSRRRLLPTLAALVQTHVVAHPGLGRLAASRQAVLQEDSNLGAVVEDAALWADLVCPPIPASTAVLEALQAQLDHITPGEKFYFDFDPVGAQGGPVLVLTPKDRGPDARAVAWGALADGRAPIRGLARAPIRGLARAPIRGLARAAKGSRRGFQFHTKAAHARFLSALADFVRTNRRRAPAIAALSGSVVRIVDANGAPIETHQDTALWSV